MKIYKNLIFTHSYFLFFDTAVPGMAAVILPIVLRRSALWYIMIAHRLKTVRHADQIFVVDHGEIVQQGTHDELVDVDGLYRRFVVERKQAAGWKV